MPVPFKVKAVYDYRSDEPDDLNFEIGQVITVTEEDDADWYTGEYTANDGTKKDGIFPRNFVEKYEPAIPTRPVRAPRKVPQPEQEPEPEPARDIAPPVASIPPPVQEPVREAEAEQPEEIAQPTPAPPPAAKPILAASPPLQTEKSAPAKKAPPPVVEKPSSFRDRIAAFNKPAAAPVTPFKPPGASGPSFVKKTYVAPPPSRNAYVPPPRDTPPVKVYRREEELENERDRPEPEEPPRQISLTSERSTQEEEEEQPKPTSLKDRIALLQQQQLEQAQRQAESSKKKEKPKRPTKPRADSHEPPADIADDGTALERVSTERPSRDLVNDEERPVSRKSTEAPVVATAAPLPAPSRELVSDTNDADDSGAADTEDSPHDMSTEEERLTSRPVRSPPMAAQQEPVAEEDEEEEEETEEEEDPEVRRKRELRERMAKMSGGMGMMGMFGAGAAPQPKRAKSQREKVTKEPEPEPEEQEQPQRAPPVPIMPGMALPGMARPVPPQARDSDDEYVSAEPTPVPTHETAEDDYVMQKPSRRSTSQTLSSQERAPPPPLPEYRPEPPSSPGARPVPPPPPPTGRGDVPLSRDANDFDREFEAASPTSAPKPPTLPGRAVPPPPPVQPQSQAEGTRAIPPPPMSPGSPPSRLPPPPPPGPPSRRTTSDSLQPAPREESEDEVTEYDGDYDTDLAPTAKHKAALRSHTRDSSIEEDTFSDEGIRSPQSSQPRAVPPPIPTTTPRDVPPAPPQITTRPRESVDSPRAPPPPIPQSSVHKPRESVDSPRTAPPPIPPTRSPADDDEDYDPYRNSTYQPSLPSMMASMRRKTGDFDSDYTEDSPVSYQPSQSIERGAPPPPPTHQPASPPPPPPPTFHPAPPERSPTQPNMDHLVATSGGLAAPRQSSDVGPGLGLGRSNTRSRRSQDVARPQNDEYIASDIDLAPNSQWYIRDNNPPPVLMNRSDVLWEVESSTAQKRGGRQSVSRDVYVLYQDYSQTTVNATYDSSEPTHVSFEQSHERPPMAPRKDQLETAHEQFGSSISKNAERAVGGAVGEGTAAEFVLSLIRPLKAALLPVGTRSYGALVYANLANASTQQFDEIRAGDIITFRNAKFAGHKGAMHQKYSQEAGVGREHVGVVIDWDGTKKKIRVWEQGNQEKGKKSKVREESYRVGDLKSGEVRVFRVMPRSWVNWGTT